MSEHRTYGIFGDNYSTGLATINAYLPGSVIAGNILAGGSASKYPVGNFFPTVAVWDASFVNFAAGDYHLLASSLYKNVATDGTDPGADIDRVNSETANAISGDDRLPPGTNAVKITTTSLPDGMVSQRYGQAVTCTGGSSGCAWQLSDSSLPSGIGFDATTGMVAGTPTAVQTGTVTVTAFDPAAPTNAATATLTLTIDPPPFSMWVPPAAPAQVGASFQLTPTVSGALGSTLWSITSGTLPSGLALRFFVRRDRRRADRVGHVHAVIQAQDSWNATRVDSKSVTITVVAGAAWRSRRPRLSSGLFQTMFTAMLNATGGTGATSWSLASGTLPPGVTLNSSGTISGVPSVVGAFPITIRAVDANWPSNAAVAPLTVVIDAPSFAVTLPAAPAGTVGIAYQLRHAGQRTGWRRELVDRVWRASARAHVERASGAIAGVPTQGGSFSADRAGAGFVERADRQRVADDRGCRASRSAIAGRIGTSALSASRARQATRAARLRSR